MDDTRLGRYVRRLATAVAIAGGSVLVLVTIMTVVSVVGRALSRNHFFLDLGFGPVKGDFEIVQAGILFAIFCALPLTQYLRGHADVSLLTDRFSARAAAVIELVMDVLMLIAVAFVVWRYWVGLTDKYANREMTFILHAPVWWIYAIGMVGALTTLIVSAYCVVRSGANSLSAHPHKPEPGIF
jgi:TRAP-type C4-dicarboxylate transport system permease small subunit